MIGTKAPSEAGVREAPGRVEDELLGALPAPSRRREVWVGAFVIIAILTTLVGLFTLTDAATFRGRYLVTTVVDDAGGIRKGDPVQMRGVNIGRVRGFQIHPDGVALRLELEGAYAVPRDSRVALRSTGMLGGLTAEVLPGTAPERLRRGDVMPGTRVDGLLESAAGLSGQADAVLAQIQAIFSDQTVGALGESAVQLRGLLEELAGLTAEQRTELSTLSASLRRSAEGIERATTGPELERSLQNLDAVLARMDETSEALGRASASLESILARMDRGEGTLGRLSVDPSLYENLNRTLESVHALTEDFRENPRRYIDLRIF